MISEMPSVGKIDLTMSAATVCGGSYNTPTLTTITFTDNAGRLPPAKVTPHTNLKLQAGSPRLTMITTTVIRCPRMLSLVDSYHGGMHIEYDGEVTRFINFTDSVVSVGSALRNLTSLRDNSDYGHINVTAATTTQGQTICSYAANTDTTIELRSVYGNLHPLKVVDSMTLSSQMSNFTATVPQATSEILECSGRGFCEETTGSCECFFKNGMEGTSTQRASERSKRRVYCCIVAGRQQRADHYSCS